MANLFDAANAPEGEPETVVVGDFIQWKRSDLVQDYPVATHSATYVARITGGGASEIQVTGSESDPTYYLFTVDSVTSTDFVPGYYHWQLEVTETASGNRIVVDTGTFTALPDLDVTTQIRAPMRKSCWTKFNQSCRVVQTVMSVPIPSKDAHCLKWQLTIFYSGVIITAAK